MNTLPEIPFAFTAERLDGFRQDQAWLAAALADPGTLFVPVRGGVNSYIWRDGTPHALLLDAATAAPLRAADFCCVLLGEVNGKPCFALGLDTDVVLPEARHDDLRSVSALLSYEDLGLLGYARAMVHWHRQHRYCGHCGALMQSARAGHERKCGTCGMQWFPRIDPAIIVLVTDGDRALLGRQASWPKGRYSTIAGFVEHGETLEAAVAREVQEETNITVQAQRYVASQPWPYPGSLMLGFRAEALNSDIRNNDGELEHAAWFTRDEIAHSVDKGLMMPPSRSISYRLIRGWFDEEAGRDFGALRHVDPNKAGKR
ncbi:MAG TPA: NAD(+) diphosphatase [Gammaproteobacteria bacterium]|nr:NAD(+) diphosphatase [Gammaproteobacteria bacterium]